MTDQLHILFIPDPGNIVQDYDHASGHPDYIPFDTEDLGRQLQRFQRYRKYCFLDETKKSVYVYEWVGFTILIYKNNIN
jgi:hypothetical protein